MKRFESDPTLLAQACADANEAWRNYRGPASAYVVAGLAEREARAILEETEPIIYSDNPCGPVAPTWDAYSHGHGLRETRAALAEALAAFVADDTCLDCGGSGSVTHHGAAGSKTVKACQACGWTGYSNYRERRAAVRP